MTAVGTAAREHLLTPAPRAALHLCSTFCEHSYHLAWVQRRIKSRRAVEKDHAPRSIMLPEPRRNLQLLPGEVEDHKAVGDLSGSLLDPWAHHWCPQRVAWFQHDAGAIIEHRGLPDSCRRGF